MAAEGFMLLYSLTLLQVYNGDGDAIMMLDDLDASRKAMAKSKDSAEGSDTFIEIILSFLGNPRTLFRKIGEEAFSIFASEIGSEGLQSLAEILDTEENLEGQKELFNQGDDEEDAKSDDDSEEDSEMGSDVEMVDSDVELLNDGLDDPIDFCEAAEITIEVTGGDQRGGVGGEERVWPERESPLQPLARDLHRQVEQQGAHADVGKVRGDLRAHGPRAEHRCRTNRGRMLIVPVRP